MSASKRSSPSSLSRPQVVLSTTLIVLALVLLCDVDVSALVRFLRWYTTRFMDYYAPKIAFVKKTLRRLESQLPELPEDVYDAWDVSTALIVVVSMFHLIERLRVALLAKITPASAKKEQ